MANVTTVYDVKTVYSLDDRASSALAGIAGHADRASSSMGGLSSALGGLAGLLSGGALFAGGKKAFIDFNSNVENAKIGIAAITKMFDKDRSFASAMEEANGLFDFYQEKAKTSTATTAEFMSMHKALAPMLSKNKASLEQMKEISIGATVAAPIFGEQSFIVEQDIKQMSQGIVTARDRVASALIQSMGFAVDQYNAKAKADPKFAVDFIQKALTSDALKEAAKAFESSFSGVVSTFQDTLQITLGKIGVPLFKAVTAEVKSWNAWIEKNPQAIAEFSSKFANALSEGFATIKTAVGFIVEHKDLLLTIGSMWAIGGGTAGGGFMAGKIGILGGVGLGEVFKGGAMGMALSRALGPSFKDAFGEAGLFMEQFNGATGALLGSVSQLPGQLGAMGTAALAAKTALEALASHVDKEQKAGISDRGDIATIMRGAAAFEAGQTSFSPDVARQIISNLKDIPGTYDLRSGLNADALRVALGNKGAGIFEAAQGVKAVETAIGILGDSKVRSMIFGTFGPKNGKNPDPVKPLNGATVNNNFNIQRVDVQSDDPDRFIAQINDAARNAWRHKTSADSVIRGG